MNKCVFGNVSVSAWISLFGLPHKHVVSYSVMSFCFQCEDASECISSNALLTILDGVFQPFDGDYGECSMY